MRKPEKRGIKLLALTQIKPPYCIEQSTVASFTAKYQHAFSNLVQTDKNKNKMKQLIYITILKPVLVTLVDHQQHLSPAGGTAHMGFRGNGGMEGEISRRFLSIKGKYRKLAAN